MVVSEPNEEPQEVPAELGVVIPAYNERGNVGALVREIEAALGGRVPHEIVVVDDASTDGTRLELAELARRHKRLAYRVHERNRGQSAAIHTAVETASAPIIAVLDGDGQNDPADIPALYERLVSSPELAMVAGERRNRNDSFVKRLSSRVANAVRSRLLGDGIRDTGCGLKVFYRADFLKLPAFDHMHRFLPALVQRNGGKVVSVPVNHRPRRSGSSKYGIRNRLWTGIIDLLGVLWLYRRRI